MICKKRVQLIHYSSQPGGIEVLLPLLIGNLKSYCFNSFVLRPSNEADYNVYKDTPIKISYGTSGLSTYWYLFKYAVKNRKDVFHVFNIGPYALIVLRLAGVRNLIYSIHGTIYWKNRSQHVLRKIIWKLAMSSKYIITSNSVFSGEVFKNKVLPQTNPILLYNPIDPQRFINFGARIEDKTKIKIVYSGRLAHGKNLFRWINIAEAIHKKFPNYRFEIYGEGPLKKSLQEAILAKELDNIISLKGFCHRAEEIYQNADLLLFLSEYESFGNVVIESIMCETPVVTGAIPSMKEIFRNNPQFLVSLDDNLEKTVLKKVEELELLKLSAKGAAVEFRERFSMNQHLLKIEKIYDSFIS